MLWIVICEYLRAYSSFDYTMGFLGYTLFPYRTLRMLAAVTGVFGLSALVVLVNAWLAHALPLAASAIRQRGIEARARELALAASVLLAAGLCWGVAYSQAHHDHSDEPGIRIKMAALQAGKRVYKKQE